MAGPPRAPTVRSMSPSVSTSPASAPPAVAFRSILCGVDGSRIAAEAARQAAILAGGSARLTLLGVAWEEGCGPTARARIEPHRLAAALETARLEARSLGVSPHAERRESRDDTATLLAQAGHHDLLVLGASIPSRATGLLAGSTATAAAHASPAPVLLARRPPAGVEFPASILAAIDGTPATTGVAKTTAALARAHEACVTVVAPRSVSIAEHRRIADAIATIAVTTGAEPLVLDEHSAAHKAIVAAASTVEAALVVIGSRGLQGVHALASVSERVAHEAPCSVLILRPPANP